MKDQILIGVAFFGGLYHLVSLIEAGANTLSLLCIVAGTGYLVHSYKETSIPERIYREREIQRLKGNV